MSRRAMIGVWDEDTNQVVASYVHYDGHLEYTGRLLVENYNNGALARQVARSGYLSVLYKNYEQSRAESRNNDLPSLFSSVEEYLNVGYYYSDADYLYLWDGNAWFFAKFDGHSMSPFEEVEMNLEMI